MKIKTKTKTRLKIYKATPSDYDKFSLGPMNRPLHSLTALIASLEKLGYLYTHPVIVEPDGKDRFLIREGHHRFAAAKILGLSFYYVIESVPHSIAQVEATHKNWSPNDYVSAYIGKGLLDYAQLGEYHKKTGISISICVMILGENTTMDEFKMGRFKVSAAKAMRAERVASIVLAAREAGVVFATHAGFVHALYDLLYLTQFDAGRMMRKIEAHIGKVKKMSDVPQYLGMLEDVYNTYAKDKVQLAFPAQRLVEKRMGWRRRERKKQQQQEEQRRKGG